MERYIDTKCISERLEDCDLEVLQQVDSTNEYLKRKLKAASETFSSGQLVVAIYQTAGKGTKGRSWADSSKGLKFSLLVPVRNDSNLRALTPFMALNLKQALVPLAEDKIFVKWPNDLYCLGGKFVGILVEALKKNNVSYLIIGVGINLVRDEEIDRNTGRTTGALTRREPQIESDFRTAVLIKAVQSIKDSVNFLPQQYSQTFIDEWSQSDILFGKKITLAENEHVIFEGKNLGIDATGRILLQNESGIEAFSLGEASVKL